MKKFLIFLLISISFCAFAANTESTVDKKVHEYQLKNGLKLIVKEDHRAPVAVFEVWYKVGSSYEPLGITGISHALEHMMFRGSKNYDSKQFLQSIAENGGQQNAFTFYDFTGYYQMMPADKLPISFKLEADRMRNLLLKPEDFAKEIQVVMEERRMRTEDNPQQKTFERFSSAAHVSTAYHHPVIGWMSDLQNMTDADLRKWYETWYAPNNAIIVVVGDVNPENIYQLAQQSFGSLKSSVLPTIKPQKEIASVGARTVIVEAPAKLPYLVMGYNVPEVTTAQEKSEPYALNVLGVILGGDSGRLITNLVRGKQIASDITVSYDPYFRLDNLFYIEAIPVRGHTVDEVKNAILEEIKNIQEHPISDAELERAKVQVLSGRIYQQDAIEFQAYEIGSAEAVGLSWREVDKGMEIIKTLTPAQIQAVARKYLLPTRLTVGILKPLPISAEQLKKQQMQQLNAGDQHVR